MNFPADLRYTKDHEWIKVNGDEAIVGITDFAQRELGDMKEGEVFGTVEAVKTVSDLYLPISGTVIEVNPDLNSNPESVNTDPYGSGWMIKMKLNNPSELDNLLTAEAYQNMVG